jgi:hypothetical protein
MALLPRAPVVVPPAGVVVPSASVAVNGVTTSPLAVNGIVLTPDIIAGIADGSVTAIQKALSSGVEEYSIGSRSLKRHQLEQLLKVLQFASNAQAALGPDGTMSAIQSRRGVPCDR